MSRFRYKAIEADYQGAANMYLQGKMAVQEAKNKVRAERAEQLQEVTDASKFVATNSTDLNNLTYGFANLIRNNLSNTHDQNRAGIATRGDAAYVKSLSVNEANQVSALLSKVNDNNELIRKGVDNGGLSNLTLDQYNFGIMRSQDVAPTVYIMNQNNELVPSVAKQSFRPFRGNDGKLYVAVTSQIQDGDKADGKITTTTVNKPLSALVDNDYKSYKAFDTEKFVSQFERNIGEKGFIDPNTNELIPYSSGQVLGSVSIYGKHFDPAGMKNVMTAVENKILSLDDDQLMSIAYDQMNMRAVHHSGFDGLAKDEVNQAAYGGLYDVNGDIITFTDADAVDLIRSTNEGDIVLSDKQKELVRGMIRNRIYTSFNVDYKEFRDKANDPKKPTKTPSMPSSFVPQVLLNSSGDGFSSNQDGVNYIMSLGSLAQQRIANNQDAGKGLNIGEMEVQLQNNGKVNVIDVSQFPKLNNLKNSFATDPSSLSGVGLLAYEDFGNVFKDMQFVDGGGNEIENINQISAIEHVVDGKLRYSISLVGDALGGIQKDKKEVLPIKDKDGKVIKSGSEIESTSKNYFTSSTDLLNDSQLKKMYQKMWAEVKDFREWAKTNGFKETDNRTGMAIFQYTKAR
jgi:hypothetical protein